MSRVVRAAFADLAAEVTPRQARRARPRRWPTASCRSPSPTWRRRSRRSPSRAAMTSRNMPSTLRRRERPACVPRRGCAGDEDGAHPSVLVAALGLWHGPRRYPRHAPAGLEEPFGERRSPICAREADRLGGRLQHAKSSDRACIRSEVGHPRARLTCAMPARTRRSRCPWIRSSQATASDASECDARAFPVGPPRPFRLHRREQGARHRSRLGGSSRRRRQIARARACRCHRERPAPAERHPFLFAGRWHEAAVFTRDSSCPVTPFAVRRSSSSRTRPSSSKMAGRPTLTAKNHLVLTRVVALPQRSAVGTTADPVMLEIFNNLFMSIAEQMGVTLQNTAYSVNIKERLDFSCAVFDHEGTLVANAPHMPVHLGSMDKSVETIIRHERRQRSGRATSTCSTRPTMAARICLTSRSARRSSTMRQERSCSGSPRAAITPTSAASRRAR